VNTIAAHLQIGAIRSWDVMVKVGDPKSYTRDNLDEHYLTIIDNMVCSPAEVSRNETD
jgi:hypothetical protein